MNSAQVYYRYPKSSVKHLAGKAIATPTLNENLKEGFAFMPFSSAENGWVIVPHEDQTEFSTTAPIVNIEGKESYLGHVSDLIEELNESDSLSKVVYARACKATTSLAPEEIFKNLMEENPNALVYWVRIENVGEWMGASPEPLFVLKNFELKTVALAGTRHISELNKCPFTDKEIEEQNMVKEYIEGVFKRLNIKYTVGQRTEHQAGELVHLINKFNAQLQPKDVYSTINALHPTPAVCGLPQQEAFSYIEKNETLNRTFYAGYLGYFNESDFSLYVNLRCAQLYGKEAILYVGGGITKDSDANSEWQETENKRSTILKAIKKVTP